jgi:hypothetical protein
VLIFCTIVICISFNANNETATDRRTFQTTALQWQMGLKNWHFVLPEDSALVAKYVGDATLILH